MAFSDFDRYSGDILFRHQIQMQTNIRNDYFNPIQPQFAGFSNEVENIHHPRWKNRWYDQFQGLVHGEPP